MDRSKFHTIVDIPSFPWQTGYRKKNMFIGSCFTENVGKQMAGLKFDTDINPFGILYNPWSVANAMRFLMQEKEFEENDLVEHNDLWHSFYHSGKFSEPEKKQTLKRINSRTKQSSLYLRNSHFLFITFGTAWVYRYKKTGQIVSNCHKIPATHFERLRLQVDEIVELILDLLNKLFSLNPDIKVVFTVSPIRHWKDGAIENQRSKAALILAVEQVLKKIGKDKCAYFPAYEIVMDELRDYRFYSDDMIHLTEFTVDHIWSIFKDNLVDKLSCEVAEKVQQLINAVNHKPFNKNTEKHVVFLNNSLKKTVELEKIYNYLNFKLEKKYFIDQLNEIKRIQ